MRRLVFIAGIIVLLQSCTAAAFDTAQPIRQPRLEHFPAEFRGKWIAEEESSTFYVDKMEFDDSTVIYEMSSIAQDAENSLRLLPDSVEIRAVKGGYVFSIAGDKIWLNYVVRFPDKNHLEVFGFDEKATSVVKHYEEEDSGEGFVFVKYYPTSKEWKRLMNSSALVRMRRFRKLN